MNPLQMLQNEHRLIEKVIAALENYVAAVHDGEQVDREDLNKFVGFIRTFADSCHHGKEEDILFATMGEHGFSREYGPVAVMLMEHQEGRRLIGILREKAEQTAAWSAEDRLAIAQAANAYAALLRNHIMKEDNILYPAAAMNLPQELLENMGEQFERFEEEKTGPGEHEKFHALADSLVEKYAPNYFAHIDENSETPNCHNCH